MVPISPRGGARRRACALLPVVAATVLAACETSDSPTDPRGELAATTSAATAPLVVTVVAPDGKTLVDRATVRAYGYKPDGTFGAVATAETGPTGVVTLDLVPGSYCLSARTAPDGWQSLNIITPPTQLATITPAPVVYGPVVRGRREYVAFSPANFQYCWQELPVRVAQKGGKETVRMVTPFVVLPEVLDLEGEPLSGVDVFAVQPVDVPWGPALPPGFKRAFLSTYDRTASPANLVVSQGAPWALEFQQSFGAFNITGTVKGVSGNGGSTVAFPVESNPLLCKQTLALFPAGEAGIDFTKVNFGYHASLALTPDVSVVAVQLIHSGNGPVTVTFRTDLPNGRWTTTVDYACADGDCGGAMKKLSGGNTQDVQVFHMPKPDGSVKTTLVLLGIPASHTAVLFAAKSPGDAVPLASRDVAEDAFFAVERPAQCVVEESNDDKWVVGDI